MSTIFESYVRNNIYKKCFEEIYKDFTKFIEKLTYINDISEILENMVKYDNCVKIKIDLNNIRISQNICHEYFKESFAYEYIGCSAHLYMVVFFNLTEKRDHKMFLIKDYTLSKFRDSMYYIMKDIVTCEGDQYWFMDIKKNTLIEDTFHTVVYTLYSDNANKRSVGLNQYMLNYVSSV